MTRFSHKTTRFSPFSYSGTLRCDRVQFGVIRCKWVHFTPYLAYIQVVEHRLRFNNDTIDRYHLTGLPPLYASLVGPRLPFRDVIGTVFWSSYRRYDDQKKTDPTCCNGLLFTDL